VDTEVKKIIMLNVSKKVHGTKTYLIPRGGTTYRENTGGTGI